MIFVKIITPEKVVYQGKAYQVTLPVSDGEVTILPKHRSYIASLKAGEILTKDKNGKELVDLAVAGGFVEFHKDYLTVLADAAERAEEIDMQKAEEARRRAEELMQRKIIDENEYARVAAALEVELAKIKVAKKYLKEKGIL